MLLKVRKAFLPLVVELKKNFLVQCTYVYVVVNLERLDITETTLMNNQSFIGPSMSDDPDPALLENGNL